MKKHQMLEYNNIDHVNLRLKIYLNKHKTNTMIYIYIFMTDVKSRTNNNVMIIFHIVFQDYII